MATIIPRSGDPRDFDEIIVTEDGLCFCYEGGGRDDEYGELTTTYIKDNIERIVANELVDREANTWRDTIGSRTRQIGNTKRSDPIYEGRLTIETVFR